ncbi:MAG: hypothetical protein HYY25_12075 [Candidatus Wallbacteria bacterium]|nr:hypothetical protein [Candidatus Wallbacteria bacterium]
MPLVAPRPGNRGVTSRNSGVGPDTDTKTTSTLLIVSLPLGLAGVGTRAEEEAWPKTEDAVRTATRQFTSARLRIPMRMAAFHGLARSSRPRGMNS